MKLFLRQHKLLIAAVPLQIAVMMLAIWYSGFKQIGIIFYAVMLGLIIMGVYLLIHYLSNRRLYIHLSRPQLSVNDLFEQADSSPVSMAVQELLDRKFQEYQLDLKSWEHKQTERTVFMNQWVHQMKTPLAVIELITQEEADRRLESISEETERLRHGLEMVLYMSRLETFDQDFQVEKVNLTEVVNEVITDYKRLFIRSRVYPSIEIDSALTVESDAKWLRFIMQQLLSNAIKYSAGRGAKVSVEASVKDGCVRLTVRDRGAGIPKTDLPRVFRPFFTGENGRNFKESTGMGLYLVKEIIGKLNHKIEIQSVVSEGTEVTILFPYAAK
ncbi:sensor histidine kinase [Paenibacillus pasadenensis]|uniref:sensor histidine kinase n=1 Tax=Paenibacillus pasadenensis TaxID=217090 RepID=UPI00203B7CC4|nr:sensor histidine kinase [Paenibacillus pasadenensis]MCM3749226.1 sensor histidine kinase [Paenibacillus pasadenensis]